MARARYILASWPDGTVLRAKVRGPAFLPKLFGHDGVTFGSTIHVRTEAVVLGLEQYVPFMRHECTHVLQYHRLGRLGFLWQYVVRGKKKSMEDEAIAAAAFGTYPSIGFL